ncbi:hypothetical protein OG21DRAFT_1603476 [Imleria badia]|nr:hypothetical protein OG21DRAFT_1603476 [Imleria badia]
MNNWVGKSSPVPWYGTPHRRTLQIRHKPRAFAVAYSALPPSSTASARSSHTALHFHIKCLWRQNGSPRPALGSLAKPMHAIYLSAFVELPHADPDARLVLLAIGMQGHHRSNQVRQLLCQWACPLACGTTRRVCTQRSHTTTSDSSKYTICGDVIVEVVASKKGSPSFPAPLTTTSFRAANPSRIEAGVSLKGVTIHGRITSPTHYEIKITNRIDPLSLLMARRERFPFILYSSGPIQILPRFWLGSEDNAHGVSAILNVPKEIPSPFDSAIPARQPDPYLTSQALHHIHLLPPHPPLVILPYTISSSASPMVSTISSHMVGFLTAMAFVDAVLQPNQSVFIQFFLRSETHAAYAFVKDKNFKTSLFTMGKGCV